VFMCVMIHRHVLAVWGHLCRHAQSIQSKTVQRRHITPPITNT